jgi:hypothetical protein
VHPHTILIPMPHALISSISMFKKKHSLVFLHELALNFTSFNIKMIQAYDFFWIQDSSNWSNDVVVNSNMINWKGELVDQDSNKKKTFDQLKRGSSSLSNKFILYNFITWILKMPNEKEFDNH